MKNRIVILFLFICFATSSQDPQLINSTWYLQDVIINEQENVLPINYEVLTISADFTDSAELQTVVCDGLCGDITYLASQFTFNSYALTLGGCEAAVNSNFQNVYFSGFLKMILPLPFCMLLQMKLTGVKL